MENKLKHLEFIQTAINRMAGNLFFLRGWVITLIAALIALLTNGATFHYLLYFLIALIVIFWILDGYFLAQERLYRALYNHVRRLEENKIDFSMDTTPYKKYKKNTTIFSMFSTTLMIFYIPLILVILGIVFFVK